VTPDRTLEFIASRLADRRKELQDFLSQGSVKDYSEYQKLCGTILGLDFAKLLIEDHANKLESEDDE
jgi:hypothetical protein